MEINDKLLEKLFQLSALSLKDQQKAETKAYLKKTLSYFEKIKTIDTTNVPPLVSPLKPPLLLRKDIAQPFSHQEELLDSAPDKQGSLVKVPPAIG